MSTPSVPPAPRGAHAGGRRLWRAVLEAYEFDEHELALLREAVRTVDICEALQRQVGAGGLLLDEGRPHPALAELRQQRLTLARLLVALPVPMGEAQQVDPGRLVLSGGACAACTRSAVAWHETPRNRRW